jgi:hypothetical protein
MKTAFAAAIAATVLLVACERAPQPKTTTAPDAGSGPSSVPAQPRPQTGTPTMEQKKEGSNPVQGQVDPKQGAQHKDFQQSGDNAGPKSAETQPK